MSSKKNVVSRSTTIQSEQANASSSGYIDDYSHLRLSYYQHQSNVSEISSGTSEDTSCDTFDTMETELSETSVVDAKEVERQKMREYYISQIPDLPHPSYTMASIISSASRKMGPMYLRYNDRIEQGSQVRDSMNNLEFNPHRRSTLKPNQFPKN